MKIVFLGDSISTQTAGIHYYGLQLVKQIVDKYPNYDYTIVASRKIIGIDIHQLTIPIHKRIPFHLRLRQVFQIPKVVKKLKPDVVIELAHFGPFNLPKDIKRITVIHDLIPLTHPQFHKKLVVLIHKWLLPGIINNADHLITNSQTTKQAILDHFSFDPQNIHVIYPTVDPPAKFDRLEETNLKSKLKKPYFLTVGTMEPRKNHMTILKAFERFCENDEEYNLVIAGGKGWKNKAFSNYLSESKFRDRVIITGYISKNEIWTLYREAYAFIFASFQEGFGIPLLEAQALGIPILASETAISKEVCANSSLYFPPNDIDNLLALMKLIVGDNLIKNESSIASLNRYLEISNVKGDYGFLEQ